MFLGKKKCDEPESFSIYIPNRACVKWAAGQVIVKNLRSTSPSTSRVSHEHNNSPKSVSIYIRNIFLFPTRHTAEPTRSRLIFWLIRLLHLSLRLASIKYGVFGWILGPREVMGQPWRRSRQQSPFYLFIYFCSLSILPQRKRINRFILGYLSDKPNGFFPRLEDSSDMGESARILSCTFQGNVSADAVHNQSYSKFSKFSPRIS